MIICWECCDDRPWFNFPIESLRAIESTYYSSIDELAQLIKQGSRDLTIHTYTYVHTSFKIHLQKRLETTNVLQRLFGSYSNGDIMEKALKQKVDDEIGSTVRIRFEPIITVVSVDGLGLLSCRIIVV